MARWWLWRIVSLKQDLFLLRFDESRTGLYRNGCFVASIAVSWRIGTGMPQKILKRLAASSAVSACAEERSSAACKSRVKRASKKQEPNGIGELCAA